MLAIRDGEDGKLFVYGEGTYVGDARPVDGTQTIVGVVDDTFPDDWKNPRIELDSGDVVWGCQCWWGPVEQLRKRYGEQPEEVVPVPEGNERWKT